MKLAPTFVVLLATVAAACSPADDTAPVDAVSTAQATSMEEETRRVPQFENEHVLVWNSIIVPNQPLEMHRHDNPRAIIALKGGTLTVTSDAGDMHDMTWETGSAYWLEADPPGELHGDVNEGDEPIEVIVVQMKGAGGS
jgi:quercetin dioxygenase-like cupin family protein